MTIETMQRPTISVRMPPLLVVIAVVLDVVVVLVAAFVAEPQSAIYFGTVLLIGNMLGNEFYLRTRRRAKLLGRGAPRIDRSPCRSSPLASVRHLLSQEDDEAKSIHRQFIQSSRWAALSRLNYPMLVIAIALSSPILAALLFALKPILNSVAFQRILDRRVSPTHLPIPTANERATQPRRVSRQGINQRISLFRWILILISVGGAVLVIIATGFTENDPEVTRPWHVIHYISDLSLSHIAGATLALLAATITALILQANRWADQAHAYAGYSLDPKRDLPPKKSWLAIYVELRALRIAIPPLIVLAIALDIVGIASIPSPSAMLLALITGALIRTPTQVCLRTAYAHSDDAALPTIESSLPLISFLVLGAFGKIYVQQWDSLVFGVIATTLGLALLHFEVDGYRRDYFGDNIGTSLRESTYADDHAMPRARHGFKALIIAMYCTGFFVYYRPTDDTERLLFRWTGDEYWGLLALSATGFFLLMAFRLTYIRNRIDAEEQKVAHLLRKIELLQRFQVLASQRHTGHELIQDMLAVDRIKSPHQTADPLDARIKGPGVDTRRGMKHESVLSHNYDQARIAFDDAWERIAERVSDGDSDCGSGSDQIDEGSNHTSRPRPDLVELSSILASVEEDFDTLTHSRQHGGSFGDFFSVGILGIATLLLALGGLPQSTDVATLSAVAWESFLLESFVILFCTVLVFLMFSLYDETTERSIPLYVGLSERSPVTLTRQEVPLDEADAYGVWFRSDLEGGIVARRVVAAFLGLVVYSSLVVLLLGKWTLLTLA